MAEDLTEYLDENGIKVRYMHSDIGFNKFLDTIEATLPLTFYSLLEKKLNRI